MKLVSHYYCTHRYNNYLRKLKTQIVKRQKKTTCTAPEGCNDGAEDLLGIEDGLLDGGCKDGAEELEGSDNG